MSKRMLLVAPQSDPQELFRALEKMEADAVVLLPEGLPHHYGHLEALRCAELSADAIVRAARESGADGVWTDDPAHGTNTVTAAARLHLPHLQAATRPQLFPEIAHHLRESAMHLPGEQVHDIAGAGRVFSELGAPLLLRACGSWGRRSCQVVEHEAELPLILDRAKKCVPDAVLLLQKPLEGARVRVLGFKLKRDFLAADIIAEQNSYAACGLPMGMTLPSGLGGGAYMEALAVARRAASLIPAGAGYVEIELICTPEGVRLSNVALPPRPHPATKKLVLLGLGVNLLAECLRVALGQAPQLGPSKDLSVAIAWLHSRSGVVQDISHTREALAMEGVHSLQITVQPGDTVGHIVDEASRDKLGYVVAVRPTRSEAVELSEAARDCIEIITKPML